MAETQNTIVTQATSPLEAGEFDYSFVETTARIAIYDDLKATPHVLKIEPSPTDEYIENLASTIDEQVKRLGGKIPYMVTREVSENFIHAQFREIVVSILDGGNTIRFADQGPGIRDKEKAQRPGFTSATEPMKEYIRGVGSGLPSARDYLTVFDGTIVIEDNLNAGAVVTVSLVKEENQQGNFGKREDTTPKPSGSGSGTSGVSSGTLGGIPVIATNGVPAMYIPRVEMEDREQDFLKVILREGEVRGTDVHRLTGVPQATVHRTLDKMTQKGLIQKDATKRFSLTPLGSQIAASL